MRSIHSDIEPRVQRMRFERALCALDLAFQILLDRVQQLADARALLRRELTEILADLGELTFATQRFHANGFHRVEWSRRASSCSSARLMQIAEMFSSRST